MTLPAQSPLRARFRFTEWGVLVPALALYLAVALPVTIAELEKLNPDGVCYLRLAQYLARGEWNAAVSLYWSPALPLCVAPWVWLGADPLVAVHFVLLAWGALLLVAAGAFLRAWTPLGPAARAGLVALLALPAMAFQIFTVAPDVILSTLLLGYLAALGPAVRTKTPRAWVLAGALAGVACWVKAYALPFVLLHLPLTWWWFGRGTTRRTLLAAGLAFLLPVVAWTGALSWKNGAFTVGKSGAINHAVVGPPDAARHHPVVFGVPEAPYVSIWETPERLPYQFWSPFASREYFQHQVQLMEGNAGGMLRTIWQLDGAGLLCAMLVALPLLAWLWPPGGDARRWFLWVAGTLAIYLGGYLLVAYEPRYIRSLLMPVLLAVAGAAILRLPAGRWRHGAALALAASVLWTWVPVAASAMQRESSPWLREAARELEKAGFGGRFAATSWYHGIALAYFTGQPHVGFPPDADPAQVSARLREAGVDWIVAFDLPVMPAMEVHDLYPPTLPRVAAVVNAGGWEPKVALRVSQNGREARVLAFRRVREVPTPSNAAPTQ